MRSDGSGVRRVLWITLGLNLAVAGAKLAYGMHSGLIAMVADGIHSVLDGSSNIVGLIAIRHAYQPPDAEHPYGHRKFETFAALGIGVLLVIACQEILKAAWHRLVDGGNADVGLVGFIVMAATMGVNAYVSWYETREGRRLGSEFLLADAAHTRSDILVSLSVMAALGATLLGWGIVDVIATFAIVAWVGWAAWRVMRPALSTLSDEVRVDPALLESIALSVEGVRDVHRVRTRGHLDAVWADLHVQVDPDVSISEAHAIAHRVEEAIRARVPEIVDVLTHLEPHGDPIEGLDGHPLDRPNDA